MFRCSLSLTQTSSKQHGSVHDIQTVYTLRSAFTVSEDPSLPTNLLPPYKCAQSLRVQNHLNLSLQRTTDM